MLLSIIIPIYNVEKYVRVTLESIYNQKFDEHEFEVICVNDGTPDNSMQIVNEFAANHINLIVINQENQGLSCARNAGLRIAKGDYIWFVDSDDEVSTDSFTTLFDNIKKYKADIYGFDMTRIFETDGHRELERIKTSKRYLYKQLHCGRYYFKQIQTAPVQRFVFRRSFLEQNRLMFCPGIIHEDVEFIGRCLILDSQMVLVDKAIYCYLVRTSGNIMSTLGMKSLVSRFKIIDSFMTLKRECKLTMQQRIIMDSNILVVILGILDLIPVSYDCRKYIERRILLLKYLLIKFSFSNLFIGFRTLAVKGIIASISFRLYLRLKKYMWKHL